MSNEEVLARHRKEKKELQAKVQGLKKAKVDKKKKKEIQDEIVKKEQELEQRHADELVELTKNLKVEEKSDDKGCDVSIDGDEEKGGEQRVSKAQRRREKKSQEEKERQEQMKVEELEFKDSPRILETKRIKEILKTRKLAIHSIPSDGDCLYNAILHQLSLNGIYEYNTKDLRKITAEYIEENKDNLICFMTNPQTDEILTDDEFKIYCDAIRHTKAWGGEVEIKSLSSKLRLKIEVIQASGSTYVHGENEYKGAKLIITYHRHLYSLGEHYNSTKDPVEEDNEEGDENEKS